jgi:lysophospholipase L1-like esterase
MFVYFDKGGTLKEIISDKTFRVGDNKKDKIYIYWEGEHAPLSGWMKYRKANGQDYPETVEECFFELGDSLVGKSLPEQPLRNLKYFSYDHTYEEDGQEKIGYLFYEITVPEEVLNSALPDNEEVPNENNLIIARFRFVLDEDEVISLGALVFSVETNVGILTDNSINETQYNYLIRLLSSKIGYGINSEKVNYLPTTGRAGVIYYLNSNNNDYDVYDVYIWNGSHYVYLGTTAYELYTKEDGDNFEHEIQTLWSAEMQSYEQLINEKIDELSTAIYGAVSGSPKGVYATVSALTSADPDHSYVYIVDADKHWYYWNGSAWADGGAYLIAPFDTSLSGVSENAVQNKVVSRVLFPLVALSESPFLSTLNLKDFKVTKVYVSGGTNNGYYNLSGQITDTTNSVHTDLLNISLVDKIQYKSNINQYGCAVAFFDENKNFLSSLTVSPGTANTYVTLDLTTAKAGGAVYASVCAYQSNAEIIFKARQIVSIDACEDEVKDNIKKTTNFFDYDLCLDDKTFKKTWVDGGEGNNGYVNKTTGAIVYPQHGVNTGFVNITFYDNALYDSSISGDGKSVAYYDENKNYLPELGIDSGNIARLPKTLDFSVAKAAGAVYVIVSSYHQRVKLVLQSRKVVGLSALTKNARKELLEAPAPRQKTLNLANGLGGFINTSGGITTGDGTAGTSDYEIVDGTFAVNAKCDGDNTVAAVSFYDNDKNFISGEYVVAGSNGVGKNGYTWVFLDDVAPSNAFYFRLSTYRTNATLTKNGGRYLIAKGQSPLNKKNILVIGDSISDSATITIDTDTKTSLSYVLSLSTNKWTRIMYDKVAPKELRCYAYQGAQYRFDDASFAINKRTCATYQVEMALNDADNPNDVFPQDSFTPDVIIFALGTNGSMNDNYESAMQKTVMQSGNSNLVDVDATIANLNVYNYMEAMRWCLMKVKKQWPKAQLFHIIPPQRANEDSFTGNTNTKYENQVKMAKYYGATIIDLRSESGICRDFQADTLSDGLHPNKVGNDLYARCVIKKVEASYMDVDDMNNE